MPNTFTHHATCACAGEGKEFTVNMTIGCLLAIIGFTMYTHAKIAAFRDVPVEPIRPTDRKIVQDVEAVRG